MDPLARSSIAMRRPSHLIWINVFYLFCFTTLSRCLDTNDIQSYLRNVQISTDVLDGAEHPEESSRHFWGIQDMVATADRVFKFTLPESVFSKSSSRVKIVEKGKTELPHWLEYDEQERTLKGIPSTNEVGKEFFLEVFPVKDLDNTTDVSDIFSVKIRADSPHDDTTAVPVKNIQNDEELRPIKCPQGSSVTMATIMVDTDMSMMRPLERVRMVHGMCHHLGMPMDIVRLMPLGNRPMFDSLALVAGPGDVKRPMYSGAMIQWEVGCGNVFANHMPILQQLENTAHDGSMGHAVGYGIMGWHVTNNKPHSAKRIKRRVHIQPTATQELMPPLPTKQPTVTSKTDLTDEFDHPRSRTIPSMSTPEFPEIKPTRTEHHHHHTRGPKTQGRHHDRTTATYEVPRQSKHRPVMATPTVVPIVPTKVVTSTTGPSEPTGGYLQPSEKLSSPGVSRSEVLIEPSMTPIAVHPTGDVTEILPTRTYQPTSTVSSELIEPTTTETFTPPTKLPPIFATDEPVTKHPKPPKTQRPPTSTTEEVVNYKPVVKDGGLGRIDVAVGDILDFEIPADNFEDYEDGNTRNLKLAILTIDGMDLTPDTWIILDQEKQHLYALPLPEHVGRHEFLLAAFDSGTKSVRDAFEIYVRMRPGERRINHEMSMALKLNYHKFLLDVHQRIDVASKLSKAFGDNDVSNIAVTNLAPGSVLYSWTNKSIPVDDCPESTLLAMTHKMITANGTINPEFRHSMQPYEVNNAKAEFKGSCAHMGTIATKSQEPDNEPEVAIGDGVGAEPKKTSEEDVLVTTVAPAVVIAAMLLLGAVIACILYRKRRKGKMSDEDQHTFLQKGVPIILPDELDDKPDPPTKPLIMEDEKPPQPPPEYPHSPAPSTPRSDYKEPLIDTDEELDHHHSPLYRPPPPPATGSLGHRNSRPRTPLSQRSPPQYMSPISP
ncbi:hypothetical protein LSH36_178g01025 [Paralvinella palmiformis]|uniref:Dystroglycan 1 n=1 Tax=Paralvinella palmiformis TaxID=53620 RepID=A0AAD9JRE1_9ANNE|nr:hypothetical protein LSH36_178g01025 [Paralvinella palmiformis]